MLCKRGCTTPFEHRLHTWEPILTNEHFQRELVALSKKILRPVVKFLDAYCRDAPTPSPKEPAHFTESFGSRSSRAND